MKKIGLGVMMVLVVLAQTSRAQDSETAPVLVRPSSSNIKDLQIRGRVHAQAGYVEADNDAGSDDYSTMELRRVRMGMRGTLFQNVRAQLEANLVPGSSLSMRSAFLEWRENKAAYIKLGLDKPRFGFEENTSSSAILTVERSHINNTMAPGPQNGLSLSGVAGMLSYGAGLYTGQENRNDDGEDRYMVNATAQVRLDPLFDDAKLRFRADFLSSDDDDGEFGFEEGVAASIHYALGNVDVRAEYMMASVDDNDTSGYYIMPSMYFTDTLQGVVRFEAAESDKVTGLRAPSRYGRRVNALAVQDADEETGRPGVDPQRGDEYSAVYVGANYYLADNAHKLMAGVEFAELDNTDQGTLEMMTVYSAWRMLF